MSSGLADLFESETAGSHPPSLFSSSSVSSFISFGLLNLFKYHKFLLTDNLIFLVYTRDFNKLLKEIHPPAGNFLRFSIASSVIRLHLFMSLFDSFKCHICCLFILFIAVYRLAQLLLSCLSHPEYRPGSGMPFRSFLRSSASLFTSSSDAPARIAPIIIDSLDQCTCLQSDK